VPRQKRFGLISKKPERMYTSRSGRARARLSDDEPRFVGVSQHLCSRPSLTNAGALDRDKQLAVVSRLTALLADAADDSSLADRTWSF
jgi:hypothetical protein